MPSTSTNSPVAQPKGGFAQFRLVAARLRDILARYPAAHEDPV